LQQKIVSRTPTESFYKATKRKEFENWIDRKMLRLVIPFSRKMVDFIARKVPTIKTAQLKFSEMKFQIANKVVLFPIIEVGVPLLSN